jgi:superfamily II DNA or RNA helicase
MSEDVIRAEFINSVHMRVTSDPGIRQELMEYFSFRPPGYQFTPSYKNRVWDGYIRMYNPMKPVLYVGLLEYLKKFCEDRQYDLNIDEELTATENITEEYVQELAVEVGAKLKPRDYQIQYIVNALQNHRSLSLSPTSSGKSFIQYLIMQHYYQAFGHRTLIIVPTIGLVHQMAGDFIEYGCDKDLIYTIQAGVDKNTRKPITISTWQSIVKQPKEWFDQFKVVLGDEAHLFQAKSLTAIMEKLTDTPYRHGFTGTISSESKVHRLVLEGVFGPIKKFISTKDLMDQGTVADFKVKALVLSYDKDIRKEFASAIKKTQTNKKYAAERAFLFSNGKRNLYIRNLVWSLKDQNNLILFDQIENQGDILKDLLKREDRILFYLHGGIDGAERNNIRDIIENDPLKRYDILASSGVFSTGVSIKRLDNAIFTAAGKSEIRVLQSIGRTLRKGNGSDKATLYDIADDLSHGTYINYTLKHFRSRIEMYSKEQFPFRIYNVDL